MINSKRKANLIESDRGKEFYNNFFQKILKDNIIKHYSRNTAIGAVFAERVSRTIGDLLKKPVFERGDANWVDLLPKIRKQCSNRLHNSTKRTAMQASLKK